MDAIKAETETQQQLDKIRSYVLHESQREFFAAYNLKRQQINLCISVF